MQIDKNCNRKLSKFIIGDDLDFYEEYTINLSDEEQQEFFTNNLDFMQEFPISRDKIYLLREPVFRGILRRIKKYGGRKRNMALIKCLNCGTNVSDKAKQCPNCGEILQTQKVVKVCEECGYELDNNTTICPKCGCPIPESEEQKKTRKKKKIIISIIAILVVILAIIAIVCVVNVTNQKKAEEASDIK